MNIMQIANSPAMWIACAIPVCFVVIQAVLFLREARGAGKEMGISNERMKAAMKCGVCREGSTLRDIRRCVEKCNKVIEMGSIIYPDVDIVDYELLGPLAWLDIPEDELSTLLEKYRPLMRDEKNRELLHTLKIYLENNMNYSLTAELLFVHINTIRKRIDRIVETGMIGDVNWEDPVERIKTILLLQFLEAGE